MPRCQDSIALLPIIQLFHSFCIVLWGQILFVTLFNELSFLLSSASVWVTLYGPLSLGFPPCLTPSVLFYRYTAVVMPVHYQHGTGQSSCRRVALMITAVWVLAFAVSCPLLFGFNTTGKTVGSTSWTHGVCIIPEWLCVVSSPAFPSLFHVMKWVSCSLHSTGLCWV